MSDINYKAEVRKVYPDALCEYTFSSDVGIRWYIENKSKAISGYFPFKKIAWKSAYTVLKNQNKL